MLRARRRRSGWRARFRGLAILIGLLAISTLVFFLDTVRRALAEGPRIVVLAAQARGLQPGATVWVAGAPAGRVMAIDFGDPSGPEERRVVIEAILHRTAAPFLRNGVRARVASSALLEPAVLKLDPGSPGGAAFDFSDTLFIPRDTIPETFLALSAAGRAGMDTLSILLDELARRLAEGPGSAARFRQDTLMAVRLSRVQGGLREIAGSLRLKEGLVHALADDSLRASLRAAADGFRLALRDETAAAVRDTFAGVVEAMRSISERLSRLDADLEAGRGTAGRGMYDTELGDQSRALREALDAAREELSRDPFRWLRFGLF